MNDSWIDTRILVMAAIVYFTVEYCKTQLRGVAPNLRSRWINALAFTVGAALGWGGLQVPGSRLLPDAPAWLGGVVLGLFAAVLAIGGHYARLNGTRARVEMEAEVVGRRDAQVPQEGPALTLPDPVPTPTPPAAPRPPPVPAPPPQVTVIRADPEPESEWAPATLDEMAGRPGGGP